MRSMPTGQPIGTFHPVATRDGEACSRDGQGFYAINLKGTDAQGAELFEVRFGDGLWMLATADDLGPT